MVRYTEKERNKEDIQNELRQSKDVCRILTLTTAVVVGIVDI